MDKLLSTSEIENLYKEYMRTMQSADGIKNMEVALTEMITIKINGLIKNGNLSANKYINKILDISLLCEDVMLDLYDIKDTQIFFTLKDNILSGYVYRSILNKDKDSFINVIKINNSFLLSSKINVNKSVFFKRLLEENNIVCANIYFPKVKKNLREKFLESMNDRILYNMFIESQFRENEIGNSKFDNNEIRALISTYDKRFRSKGFSVEEAILNSLKGYIENSITKTIDKILNNVNITSPNNINNIDYLYNEFLFNMDSLISHRLNKCLVTAKTQKGNLVTVDLLLIKDIINRRESKRETIETTLDDLGVLYEKLFDEIRDNFHASLNMCLTPYERLFNNIKTALKLNMPKTFDVYIDGHTINDCTSFGLMTTTTTIDRHKYFTYQICFINVLDKKFLVKPLDIKKFLSLKLSYKGTTIYSLPDKIKNLITDFEEKIESIKQIDYYK